MSTTTDYHVPVMLRESIEGLALRRDGTYVDVTFGGGGHSGAILRQLGPRGRLFAFDQDRDVLPHVPDDGRLTFVLSNFCWLANWMRYYEVEHIDGLIADLGVSSHHFDEAARGFSFRHDAPLDMRMNRQARLTAAQVVATYSEEELTRVFRLYGELGVAHRLARALVKARSRKSIDTVNDLLAVTAPLLPRDREKKETAKIFQALRIEVNHEMQALEQMLEAAIALLAPGGRLSVLTYHSLEDRIVKNFVRAGRADGQVETDFYGHRHAPLEAVNNKVIVPGAQELALNPRSRSAKLRIAQKRQSS